MRLLFATHNDHKAEENKRNFVPSRLRISEITTLKDLGDMEELAEDGDTLQANALQKALQVWNRYGIRALQTIRACR